MLEQFAAEIGPIVAHNIPEASAPTKIFSPYEAIYEAGDQAHYFHTVLKGAVCTYKLLLDGRRQIASFYLPGEAFGLEDGPVHSMSAEAITCTQLGIVSRSSSLARAHNELLAGADLTAWTMVELLRSQRRLFMLSQTVEARLASFLL